MLQAEIQTVLAGLRREEDYVVHVDEFVLPFSSRQVSDLLSEYQVPLLNIWLRRVRGEARYLLYTLLRTACFPKSRNYPKTRTRRSDRGGRFFKGSFNIFYSLGHLVALVAFDLFCVFLAVHFSCCRARRSYSYEFLYVNELGFIVRIESFPAPH